MLVYWHIASILSSIEGGKLAKIEKRIADARRQVAALKGQQAELARHLDVHYNWVRQFADGTLKEPGAVKFDHLEEWLKKHG